MADADLEELQQAARMASPSAVDMREMFQFDRHGEWQQGLSRRATLQQVSAGAGCLAVGVDTVDESARLVRILPNIPVRVEECEFILPDIRHVTRTWTDPSGFHVLVSGTDARGRQQATYYLNVSSSKPSSVGRLKNSSVNAAAWCTRSHDPRDREMIALVGTEDGSIYRLEFEEIRLKKTALLGSLRGSIEAMHIQWYKRSRSEWKLRVVALVKDAGGVKMFVKGALDTPEEFFEGDLSQAMPEAPASHTGLSVYTPQRSSQEISNKPVIAFLTDLGVSIATLTEERREDQPAIDAQVIPIPTHASPDSSASGQAAEPLGPPISLLVTRFHVLLLFPHHFVALNRLDYHISFQKRLSKSQFGTMKSIFRDRGTGAIWALSGRNIFRVNVTEEDRDMWRLYLDRAKRSGDQAASAGEGTRSDFDTAIRFTKTNEQREEVYQTHAEFLFNTKEMTKAAEVWAQTSQPLEEVSLRFLAIPEIPGLIHFLRQRLVQLRPEHRIQRIALATWIVELYLNCLSAVRTEYNRPSQLRNTAMYARKESELQSTLSEFMRQNREWLDRNTTIQLLASHGRTDLLVNYCDDAGEFERIVSLHIQEERWNAAIQILDDIDPVIAAPLLYKYSPILVRHQPAATGAVWRHCKDTVDANRLIPALVTCIAPSSHSHADDAGPDEGEVTARNYLLWYLSRYEDGEFDVSPSPELYQMLLSMLVRMDDETTLLQFVRQQCTAAQEARRSARAAMEQGSIPEDNDSTGGMSDASDARSEEIVSPQRLDLNYALRLCAQTGKFWSQAELSFAMGMYETAIQLLLSPQVRDTAAARQFVRELQEMPSQDVFTPYTTKHRKHWAVLQGLSPREHRELVRRLWLILASGVMESSNEVSRVIALMHEANSTSNGWSAVGGGGSAYEPLATDEEDDVLTIEDILPLFRNDAIIDHFKRPIMDSLKEYSGSITSLRNEMGGYTTTADQLKEIVDDLKNRLVHIDPRTNCSLCGSPLGDGPVYAFRTGMRYHRHCLVQSTARYLPADRQMELNAKVAELHRLETSRGKPGAARGDHVRIAELQRALDEIVGKRDVMTSDEIIESIDIALPDPTIAFREETGRRQSDPDWDV